MECPCDKLDLYCFLAINDSKYDSARCEMWPPDIVVEPVVRTVAARSGLYFDANLPRFKTLDLNLNDIIPQVTDVMEFLTLEGTQRIILYSPITGTGKTHCLLSLYFEALKQRRKAYYVTAPHLKSLIIKELQNKNEEYHNIQLSKIFGAKFLLLDEVGAELDDDGDRWYQTDYENRLCALLEGDRKIAIATNLSPDRMTYRDGRLYSRLKAFVPIKWPENCKDVRGIMAQARGLK